MSPTRARRRQGRRSLHQDSPGGNERLLPGPSRELDARSLPFSQHDPHPHFASMGEGWHAAGAILVGPVSSAPQDGPAWEHHGRRSSPGVAGMFRGNGNTNVIANQMPPAGFMPFDFRAMGDPPPPPGVDFVGNQQEDLFGRRRNNGRSDNRQVIAHSSRDIHDILHDAQGGGPGGGGGSGGSSFVHKEVMSMSPNRRALVLSPEYFPPTPTPNNSFTRPQEQPHRPHHHPPQHSRPPPRGPDERSIHPPGWESGTDVELEMKRRRDRQARFAPNTARAEGTLSRDAAIHHGSLGPGPEFQPWHQPSERHRGDRGGGRDREEEFPPHPGRRQEPWTPTRTLRPASAEREGDAFGVSRRLWRQEQNDAQQPWRDVRVGPGSRPGPGLARDVEKPPRLGMSNTEANIGDHRMAIPERMPVGSAYGGGSRGGHGAEPRHINDLEAFEAGAERTYEREGNSSRDSHHRGGVDLPLSVSSRASRGGIQYPQPRQEQFGPYGGASSSAEAPGWQRPRPSSSHEQQHLSTQVQRAGFIPQPREALAPGGKSGPAVPTPSGARPHSMASRWDASPMTAKSTLPLSITPRETREPDSAPPVLTIADRQRASEKLWRQLAPTGAGGADQLVDKATPEAPAGTGVMNVAEPVVENVSATSTVAAPAAFPKPRKIADPALGGEDRKRLWARNQDASRPPETSPPVSKLTASAPPTNVLRVDTPTAVSSAYIPGVVVRPSPSPIVVAKVNDKVASSNTSIALGVKSNRRVPTEESAEKKLRALRKWRSASYEYAIVLFGAAQLPRKAAAKVGKMPGASWVLPQELGKPCSLPMEVRLALAECLHGPVSSCESPDDNEMGRDFVLLMTFTSLADKAAAVARLQELEVDTSGFDNTCRIQVEFAYARPALSSSTPATKSQGPLLPESTASEATASKATASKATASKATASKATVSEVTVSEAPAPGAVASKAKAPGAMAKPTSPAQTSEEKKAARAIGETDISAPVVEKPVVSKPAATNHATTTREKAMKALEAERLFATTANGRAAKVVSTEGSASADAHRISEPEEKNRAERARGVGSTVPGPLANSGAKRKASPPKRTIEKANVEAVKSPAKDKQAASAPSTSPRKDSRELKGGKTVGKARESVQGGDKGMATSGEARVEPAAKENPQPPRASSASAGTDGKVSPVSPPIVPKERKSVHSKAAEVAGKENAKVDSTAGSGVDVLAVRPSSPVPPARRTPSPVPMPKAVTAKKASPVSVRSALAEPRALSPARRSVNQNSAGGGGGASVTAERLPLLPLKGLGKKLIVERPSGVPDPTLRKWPYRFDGEYFRPLKADPRTGEGLSHDISKNASYAGVIPSADVLLARLRELGKQRRATGEMAAPAMDGAVPPAVSAAAAAATAVVAGDSACGTGEASIGKASGGPGGAPDQTSNHAVGSTAPGAVPAAPKSQPLAPSVATTGVAAAVRSKGVGRAAEAPSRGVAEAPLEASVSTPTNAPPRDASVGRGKRRWLDRERASQIRKAEDELRTLQEVKIPRIMKSLADVSQQRRKLEAVSTSIAAASAAASERLAQDSRNTATALLEELRARREASRQHPRQGQQLERIAGGGTEGVAPDTAIESVASDTTLTSR